MGIAKCEPKLDDLLSDPMMATVLQHARTTADDVRSIMRDARERMASAKGNAAVALGDGSRQ